VVPLVLGINTALVTDEILHGFESSSVGSHDNDLLVFGESASDSGELGKGTHEDGLVSKSTSEGLLPHHEPTVSGDSMDLVHINEVHKSFLELLLAGIVHGVHLADTEGEAGDDTVEDIVSERSGMVDITGSWWVVVIESDDSEARSSGVRGLISRLAFNG